MGQISGMTDKQMESIPFGQRGRTGEENPYREAIRKELAAGRKGGTLTLEPGEDEKRERTRLVSAIQSEGWKPTLAKKDGVIYWKVVEQIDREAARQKAKAARDAKKQQPQGSSSDGESS